VIATVILLGSLGLDTFAVALGLGLSGLPRGQWPRVGLTFACFEGLMPVAGLLIGRHVTSVVGGAAGYVAAGLLIVVGLLAIREALADRDDGAESQSTEGGKLLLTGLSVSLDELAVGFSLGTLHIAQGPALAYIAAQAFVVTFAGLAFGSRLGRKFEGRAEVASGVVLTLLGIALLAQYSTGSHFLP
jgi:manganese efflux pump family protein